MLTARFSIAFRESIFQRSLTNAGFIFFMLA
jgi:hypothetical protein